LEIILKQNRGKIQHMHHPIRIQERGIN